MRLPVSNKSPTSLPESDQQQNFSNDRVFLHGTLFVYVRRARDLGRSHTIATADKEVKTRALVKNKLSAGARFLGKKMLNAVRTTNHVRFALRTAFEYASCRACTTE